MPPRASQAVILADRLIQFGMEHFGRYYGSYRAFVVDNVDDQNQGKLIVRCPGVGDGQDVKRVAYPKVMSAGKGYGFKDIPPKGTMVWVEFERGKLDVPIWTGGWWAKEQLPTELQDVASRGWFTPGGHQLLLDEKEGQETFRIKHLNGALIEIDKDGNIRVTNKNGAHIYVGASANEKAVLGDTLKGLLDELFDAIAQLTVGTGVGPSSTPINAAVFSQIKARLDTCLSQTVLVK